MYRTVERFSYLRYLRSEECNYTTYKTFIPQSVSRTVSLHYEAGCKFNIDPGGAPACDAVGQEM